MAFYEDELLTDDVFATDEEDDFDELDGDENDDDLGYGDDGDEFEKEDDEY